MSLWPRQGAIPILSPATWSLRRKIVVPLLALFLLLAGTLIWDLYSPEYFACRFAPQPSAVPQASTQAVFTAHVVLGGSLFTRSAGKDAAEQNHRYWALALVRQPFWGIPQSRKLVVLTLYTRNRGNPFAHGEDYFVDGDHWKGILTRFLPVFETYCTRTAPLKVAEVDLRVLRDASPREGVRIVGYTGRATDDYNVQPVPGVKVVITGPTGRTVATSDESGIFDVSALPPGDYEVDRTGGGRDSSWKHPACRWIGREAPKSGDVRACTVFTP